MNIHPVAALFPMLPADELDELTADISANGLIHPIVLDEHGTLIDGRNRLEACNRAGVKPEFETYDGNAIAFIIAANIRRRHLSQGQRAMAMVMADYLPSIIGQTTLAEQADVGQSMIGMAQIVKKWTPEYVDDVLAGGSLRQAYEIAASKKREDQQQKALFASLRERFPVFTQELAERISEGELTVGQALVQVQALADAEVAQQAARAMQQRIELLIEGIGNETEIRVKPDLNIAFESSPPDPPRSLQDGLAAQEQLLQRLQVIKRELEQLARVTPERDGWWLEGNVKAVRAAVTQIVDSAYAIAETHNALLQERPLRRVR